MTQRQLVVLDVTNNENSDVKRSCVVSEIYMFAIGFAINIQAKNNIYNTAVSVYSFYNTAASSLVSSIQH